jgi:hypothetical protein
MLKINATPLEIVFVPCAMNLSLICSSANSSVYLSRLSSDVLLLCTGFNYKTLNMSHNQKKSPVIPDLDKALLHITSVFC